MNRKKITNTILAVGYCLPIAFAAVFMDWAKGQITFYWFYVAFMLSLFFIAFVEKKLWLAVLGNVVSAAVSYGVSLLFMKPEKWAEYSKLHTPQSWIITVSVIMLLLQILFWALIRWVAKRRKKQDDVQIKKVMKKNRRK